ncbi:homocysteine-responsive endoplasmic reticulum-resident ubiquitin-like domain member 2 protein isoform X1 [Fundulus heteroclitus]|uniref:homocysteine-responsive endoplasmic reticulum-resident ubiquitin-like domain member 2 protein isoform X1 n=1 Tax=Fundulus heteroclitus TaxID=8078 RepID=UPI00165C1B79|nr:homocysteine-responsive endoplasmic reticulum-resident ubiquitin-like domain member 2 protein isoform X1 [Fundulus heteroclitus]XP_036001210.1 homocysteine-responsive endoplasmic reticulum-resident ubiquitin-like domain member 2 protein isoform X1 [Fundulus heteroclitus]XP_036001211.1 homocysteine-responsive endoplasmic reticulum-resident ubiquitin-like domain member 2 protein isoform X1 [Fundulus heteroclitus]XP_036001212.1 homocysteine-responsive endoplasmic reticulum-resident ubiquitin-lik
MDQAVVDSPVILVIRAPNQKYDDQTINCYQDWTVEKLKAHLSDVYPSKPSSKDQRLVYSGKLLLDHLTLKDVLRKQDEYHMLHLVCASRTPPSSPKPPRSRSNKPQESAAGPAGSQTPSSAGQAGQTAAGESNDWLRQQAGAFPYHHMYSQFMHSWSQQMATAPINMPSYYTPMTLMWWQQLYARQYFLHYQLLAASSQQLRPDQTSTQSSQSDPLSQRPQAGRHGNPEVQMNAQGGEILNEEELNRDWLDWVYTFSRAAILLSIVYFYSSFSRFVMVMMAMLVLYLHQAGWFPFNLENELQLPGDRANQEEAEPDLQNQDLQEVDGGVNDGGVNDDASDDDGESGEEGAEDPNSAPNAGFLSSTWSFIITFFMSLIPEGPQNVAN